MKARFILIVEDDVALQTVLARVLEAHGYLVLTAGSLREARERLAVRPVLVILDLGLPDASGWAVSAWMLSIGTPVPTVIITGGTPDADQLARFRPVALLRKPFAIHHLLTVVAEHVAAEEVALGM
ncbi:MAG TPA: response regulator [Chloroflexia bacterium]|nr:response regulator [Chloroflexia bacterium]